MTPFGDGSSLEFDARLDRVRITGSRGEVQDELWWLLFVKVCKTLALSSARTWRLNTASPGIETNDCRHWQPIWLIAK
jgi:hypothetical protein